MSAATLSAPKTEAASSERDLGRPVRRQPARLRPAGRSGRSLAPRARPARPLAAPSLNPTTPVAGHACLGDTASPTAASLPAQAPVRIRTSITDRGIAVILVATAMIVLAAVTVVGLTALRVTSDSYQPLPPAYAAQP